MRTPPPCPTAIVDFAGASRERPVRRRFERPVRELRALALDEVMPALDEAEGLARSGLWVVGFVAYEAASAFDSALVTASPGTAPLAWFAAFDAPCTGDPVGMAPADAPSSSWLLAPTTEWTDARHAGEVERIRRYIVDGEVYQVNLTLPFTAQSGLSPLAMYERMRIAQGGAYSAYLDLSDVQIISASPELFFDRRGCVIRSRPMKGTAPRGLDAAGDLAAHDTLLRSEKELAENVMIVDVVRNDLGRVARLGTVNVPVLCEAERYPSVWQLTSTIEAEVDPALPLSAIFGALFPSGSITGAPKIRATEIIRELEAAPRGVYCGSIGLLRPGGDATFNVAIRTAWTADDGHTVHLNAGGGITIDSTAPAELAEVRAKLAAYTEPALRPSLFETIRVEQGQPVRLERHLRRMAASARYFDLPFHEARAVAVLLDAVRAAAHAKGDSGLAPAVVRGRLVLEPDGALHASVEPFSDQPADAPLSVVAIAPSPVDRRDVRLYHKTTSREVYDAALSNAGGRFDAILWNEAGEVTELTRGNLVAEIGGTRWTPPISCGLLGGTLRAELVETGAVRERVLHLENLAAAERLWFVNSLRGWVPIVLGH